MNKITIYHQPTDTYFYVEDINEYMRNMKGDFLSYDIFKGIFIDNEETHNPNETIIVIE